MIMAVAEPDSLGKVDNSRFEAFANSLFVEQYKANRAEILASVQTSHRSFQFCVTAFVALNSIAIGFIIRAPVLSVFDGYVIALYYGVVVTMTMLVFSVAWFMEMLRLTRAIVFLKYLEDRLRNLFVSPPNQKPEPNIFRDRFDGYVVFWENWARGSMESNRFNYIKNFPYVYNISFLALVCVVSAAIAESFFINAVLSEVAQPGSHPANVVDRVKQLFTLHALDPLAVVSGKADGVDQFTQVLTLRSLNPFAVIPWMVPTEGRPFMGVLLWANWILMVIIAAMAFTSANSGLKMVVNVLRASRADHSVAPSDRTSALGATESGGGPGKPMAVARPKKDCFAGAFTAPSRCDPRVDG